MSIRALRRLLGLATITCLLIAGLAGFAILRRPLNLDVTPVSLSSEAKLVPSDGSPVPVSLGSDDFQYVWGKRLQRPLVDPVVIAESVPNAVTPPPKPPAPVIPLNVKLLGILTDADPSFARAWIEVGGKQNVLSERDIVPGHQGDPMLVEIRDESVVIELSEQRHTLKLEFPKITSSEPGE